MWKTVYILALFDVGIYTIVTIMHVLVQIIIDFSHYFVCNMLKHAPVCLVVHKTNREKINWNYGSKEQIFLWSCRISIDLQTIRLLVIVSLVSKIFEEGALFSFDVSEGLNINCFPFVSYMNLPFVLVHLTPHSLLYLFVIFLLNL